MRFFHKHLISMIVRILLYELLFMHSFKVKFVEKLYCQKRNKNITIKRLSK